jgi:PAS domain S-box-containing protein
MLDVLAAERRLDMEDDSFRLTAGGESVAARNVFAVIPRPNGAAPSYAHVLDALPIIAFMAAADGSISYVSHGWSTFTGYAASEAVGAGYRWFIHPDDLDEAIANWSAARVRELPYSDEYRLRLRDGSFRWVLSEAAPVRDPATGTVTAWFGTVIDIDQRRRTADALRESESMYRTLSEALPGVTWAASPAGDLTYVGDRWREIHAESRDRALGDGWLASIHPDDRDRVVAAWAHSLRTAEPYKIEFRVLLRDGSYHWFLVRALPVYDAEGSVIQWVGVNIDIDDRYAADQAREMYAALVENSTDFIGIADRDGNILYVNTAGRTMLGIGSLETARTTQLSGYFLPADRPFVESEILPAVERDGSWSGDFQFVHARTGEALPVAFNLFALEHSDGTRLGTATVSRDLRERKRVEDGLRLLSRTGAAVVDSLDYQRTLENIALAFVDGFAAYCLIDVMPPNGSWQRTAQHREPSFIPLLTGLSRPVGNHPVARAIEYRESRYSAINEPWARSLDDRMDGDRVEVIRRLGVRSIITVPIVTPSGDVVGAITCALDDVNIREDYGPDDLGFVEEVGRRAGAAIANVQLYERERRIALELQSASLPSRVPKVEGVALDVVYRPGSNEAKIGGDWYDAFLLADKRLVLTVGDVLGHGLHAAVSMTKLRLAMQSAALVDPDPYVMLRVADATLRLSDPDAYATAIAAVYDPVARAVTFASAGHPGPVLRTPDGRIEEYNSFGLMLGLRAGDETQTRTIFTPPGSTLVLYTDGLIEIGRDLEAGFGRLESALRQDAIIRSARPAEALVDAVLGSDAARDDIAVLVVSFL